jgi:hypothetical protein
MRGLKPMTNLQEVFQRMAEAKKERKKLQESYKDALANSKPYQDVLDDLKKLKDKKLHLESTIKADFQQEISKLENLKDALSTDAQLMSDMALTALMKGETVEITDEHDTKYEPVFSVKFKKAG